MSKQVKVKEVQEIVHVAPTHPLGKGSRKYGGHVIAYFAQGRFDRATKFELITRVCPWGEHTPAATMHRLVLLPLTEGNKATTVGDIIDAAGKLKTQFSFTAREVQDHLRWLYTWTGYGWRADGNLYPAQPSGTIPVRKRAAKAEAVA